MLKYLGNIEFMTKISLGVLYLLLSYTSYTQQIWIEDLIYLGLPSEPIAFIPPGGKPIKYPLSMCKIPYFISCASCKDLKVDSLQYVLYPFGVENGYHIVSNLKRLPDSTFSDSGSFQYANILSNGKFSFRGLVLNSSTDFFLILNSPIQESSILSKKQLYRSFITSPSIDNSVIKFSNKLRLNSNRH